MAACVGLCGAAILIIRYDSARRTLERLRSDTESVLQCLAGGLITIDLNGRVTRFNPAAERILGLKPERLRSRTLAEVFEARAPLLFHKLTRSLRDGVPINRFEFHLRVRPDLGELGVVRGRGRAPCSSLPPGLACPVAHRTAP